MDKVTTIAVDIAKRVFSAYWVDAHISEIGARMMTRAKFEEFMRTLEPRRVNALHCRPGIRLQHPVSAIAKVRETCTPGGVHIRSHD